MRTLNFRLATPLQVSFATCKHDMDIFTLIHMSQLDVIIVVHLNKSVPKGVDSSNIIT